MCESISMNDVFDGKDKYMIFEENRLKSFVNWPLSDGQCTKESLSSCGFYNTNIQGEEDGVRCFCCFKELDGWDPKDDPWAEHKRNNNCYFANLGKPQNKLTVKEYIKVIEEREMNLLNKRFEEMQKMSDQLINGLGLHSTVSKSD